MFQLSHGHGKAQETLCVPGLRQRRDALAGPVRRMPGMEFSRRGRASDGVLAETRPVFRRSADRARRDGGNRRGARTHRYGTCRIRSRARRRAGGRQRDPDGRRSGDRQVDPAAAGGGQYREIRPRRGLYLGRGSPCASPHARPQARCGRCAGAARERDQCARYLDHARAGRAARADRDRFDPDDVLRPDRGRARHRQPSAWLRFRVDPLRQGMR